MAPPFSASVMSPKLIDVTVPVKKDAITMIRLVFGVVLLFAVTSMLASTTLTGDPAEEQTRIKWLWLQGAHDHSRRVRSRQSPIHTALDKIFHDQESIIRSCRYEGHCPVGTTCATSNSSHIPSINDLPGRCERYIPNEILKKTDPCIVSCLNELKWDEQFYFDSKVNLEGMWSTESAAESRPNGCIIQYHRTPQSPWSGFSLDKWKEEVKHHYIVRVDPVQDDKEQQAWRAFCYSPCQNDSQCAPHYECQSKQCRATNSYWTPTNQTQHDMVIVTGATSSYFGPMRNLVASCLYWAPEHSVVIYNLGMTNKEIKEAKSWPNVIQVKWEDGFPSSFPEHVLEGKKYAWKPIAINESVHEFGNIFWLDAGNTLVGPIDPAERIVHDTGIFLVRGQDSSMTEKSHPLTYQYFGFDKNTFQGGPHYSGNTQAFLYPSRYIDTIVIPNAACAIDPACITPHGSELTNHRFDQTTLSVLTYQQHIMVPARTEYLAASKSQLNSDMTLPSFMFVWTARGICKVYSNLMRWTT